MEFTTKCWLCKAGFNVIFNKEPEGGFTASVPTLPGCITYGEDLGIAKEMIQDAIKSYVESLLDHKEVVPTDNDSFVSSIVVHSNVYV